MRELCMFRDELGKSHKVCSEIIHITSGDCTLAYVVSLEKVYGSEDTVIVRLTHVEKVDNMLMSEYSWQPTARP